MIAIPVKKAGFSMNSKTGDSSLGRSSTVDPAGSSTVLPGDASIKGMDIISPSDIGAIDRPIPEKIFRESLFLLRVRKSTNDESKTQNMSGKIENKREAIHKFQARDSVDMIQDILALMTSAVI